MVNTNRQVRAFLNNVAKKKYKKPYKSLSLKKQAGTRKSAMYILRRKR